jgi:hypothetical protein
MTARPILRNRVQIGNSVDKGIWERFQSLTKQTKIPISKLLDEAMDDLVEKYRARGLYQDKTTE